MNGQISSDLVQKLYESGFPQINSGEGEFRCGTNNENIYYFPSLSELIRECGMVFETLSRNHAESWVCTGESGGQEPYDYIGEGKNPEEAVANLWLTLNKKNEI